MVPQVAGNVAQQVKQLAQDSWETFADQPKEFADEALEQLGVKPRSNQNQANQTQKAQADYQSQLKAAQEQDKHQADQQLMALRKDLEGEIKKWEQVRDQDLAARRKEPEPNQSEAHQASQAPIAMPEARRAKGSWMQGAKRRIKSAWEQFAPEQAGKRGAGG